MEAASCNRSIKSLALAIVSVAIFVGAAVALLMLYITWHHNPQCEFHCEGVVNWKHWLWHGLVAGVIGFLAALVVSPFLVTLSLFLKRRNK